MRMKWLCVALVGWVSTAAFGQVSLLDQNKVWYAKEQARIDTFIEQASAKAVVDYEQALGTLKETLKKSGDLAGVLAVNKELAVVAGGKTIPLELPANDAVARVVKKAQAGLVQIEAAKQKYRADLTQRYIAGLTNLKKQLVAKEQLDEAIEVDAEIKDVQSVSSAGSVSAPGTASVAKNAEQKVEQRATVQPEAEQGEISSDANSTLFAVCDGTFDFWVNGKNVLKGKAPNQVYSVGIDLSPESIFCARLTTDSHPGKMFVIAQDLKTKRVLGTTGEWACSHNETRSWVTTPQIGGPPWQSVDVDPVEPERFLSGVKGLAVVRAKSTPAFLKKVVTWGDAASLTITKPIISRLWQAAQSNAKPGNMTKETEVVRETPTTGKNDPIVGEWSWGDCGSTHFGPDGTLLCKKKNWTGTWTFDRQSQRYKLKWDYGLVEEFELLNDGKSIKSMTNGSTNSRIK